MVFEVVCSNSRSPVDFVKKCCVFNESTGNSKVS